jgi:hypothetical protein
MRKSGVNRMGNFLSATKALEVLRFHRDQCTPARENVDRARHRCSTKYFMPRQGRIKPGANLHERRFIKTLRSQLDLGSASR